MKLVLFLIVFALVSIGNVEGYKLRKMTIKSSTSLSSTVALKKVATGALASMLLLYSILYLLIELMNNIYYWH